MFSENEQEHSILLYLYESLSSPESDSVNMAIMLDETE